MYFYLTYTINYKDRVYAHLTYEIWVYYKCTDYIKRLCLLGFRWILVLSIQLDAIIDLVVTLKRDIFKVCQSIYLCTSIDKKCRKYISFYTVILIKIFVDTGD